MPYSVYVDISYDDDKDATNRAERGIPLAFGANVIAASIGELQDTRYNYGEIRMRNFGIVDGKCFQCVYTTRGATRHIITVHRIAERRARKWLGQ
jgi:uncharacterized protein